MATLDATKLGKPMRYFPLSDDEAAKVLRYMQQTKQDKILLMYRDDYVMVEKYDGAIGAYQESGYHDDIHVFRFPAPIRIAGIGESWPPSTT